SVTVNMTAITLWGNITNIESSSAVQISLHVYGYLIIGPMLILINAPVFVVVMMREALRSTYSSHNDNDY
ncbi:unnamed protein product, partial [Acanthocheilonema viteae]